MIVMSRMILHFTVKIFPMNHFIHPCFMQSHQIFEKVQLSPSYVLPAFLSLERARLTSFWLGLVGEKSEPPLLDVSNFEIPTIVTPDFTSPVVSPMHHVPTNDLRARVIAREATNPTLKPPYKKFAKMLENDEIRFLLNIYLILPIL